MGLIANIEGPQGPEGATGPAGPTGPEGPAGTNTDVVSTPFSDNFSMPLANTEYAYAFPDNTRRFMIQNRNVGIIKLSYTSGESGTNYFSLSGGVVYSERNIETTTITLYLQSPSANQLLEVISWS